MMTLLQVCGCTANQVLVVTFLVGAVTSISLAVTTAALFWRRWM